MQTRLRIGTRGSALALKQTREFIVRLAANEGWDVNDAEAHAEIVVIKTTGDTVQDRSLADIGGKGLFAKEIEEALLSGRIDCAVHSLKDMPSFLPPELAIVCHLEREDPRDAFVSQKAASVLALVNGAVVGSSSVRRRAILLNLRPDLRVIDFRGNVDTRLRKLAEGQADATVLALAGLKRLGAETHVRHIFSADEMLPSVAQGVIAIEVRTGDIKTRDRVGALDHRETALAAICERAFLQVLDGSCKTPLAGLAERRGDSLHFRGAALSLDGTKRYDTKREATTRTAEEAEAMGRDAGEELLKRAGRAFFTQ
ncbi:MAG: hydroxymethylbilane synthase [Alphaproteobacteria bacterium]|nr:hydroxymethylbilane synthase [Alphaproteobacteria bacterium]